MKPSIVVCHLTPKHPRKPKWLFVADLGRLLLMQ
jgi:hypothetical protein